MAWKAFFAGHYNAISFDPIRHFCEVLSLLAYEFLTKNLTFDLWLPNTNQFICVYKWTFMQNLRKFPLHSWDIQTNGRYVQPDRQAENIMPPATDIPGLEACKGGRAAIQNLCPCLQFDFSTNGHFYLYFCRSAQKRTVRSQGKHYSISFPSQDWLSPLSAV